MNTRLIAAQSSLLILAGLMMGPSPLQTLAVTFPPAATEAASALRFAGAQWLEVSRPEDFNLAGSLTVETWVRIGLFDRDEHPIAAKTDAWELIVVANSNNNPKRRIGFRTGTGQQADILENDADLTVNRWYHVAAVFDSVQKRIYIDGALRGSKAYSTPLRTSTAPVTFGTRARSPAPNAFYNGDLDHIRIWSRARSALEIWADIDRRLHGDEAGLLGEWRFDETTGLFAFDSSLGKRDAALRAMNDTHRVLGLTFRPPPPRASEPANALLLEGAALQFAAVDLAHEGVFDATLALTIEAWINIGAFDQPWQAIVTKGDAWGITRHNQSSRIAFRTVNTSGGTQDLASQSELLPGRWYHVAAVFSGSVKILYIDGVPEATSNFSGPLQENDHLVVIGGNAAQASRAFRGVIDSVRIWSTARTEQAIHDHMQRWLRGSEPGLLGDWRFNEESGNSALDSSYDEHHATLSGMDPSNRVAGLAFTAAPPPVASEEHGALALAGGNPEPRVEVEKRDAFNLVDRALTIEAWVNISIFDRPWQAIVTKGEVWGLTRFQETGRIAFRTHLGHAASDLASQSELEPNRWYHLAAVFDGANKFLYIDGVLDASTPFEGSLLLTSQPLTFGANAQQSGRAFKGILDAIRVWSIARTAEQIKTHLDRDLRGTEPGLLGEWRFNESVGNTIQDSSQNQLNALLLDAGSDTPHVDGLRFRRPAAGELAIFFDQSGGATQFVQLPGEDRFEFTGPFTVEMWVYFDKWPSGTVALVSKGAAAWAVNLHSSGKIQFHTRRVNDGGGLQSPPLSSVSTLDREKWHHVTATWNPSLREKVIYLNGLRDATASNLQGGVTPNGLPVLFAAEPASGGGTVPGTAFEGILDEVRLWSAVRSEERIRESHTRGVNGTEPRLAGFWSMNEGSGVTTIDGKANPDFPGVLAPGMTSLNRVEGKVLAAPLDAQYTLLLDGTDDYLEVAHAPGLNLTGDATLEAWIKPSAKLLPSDLLNPAALATSLALGAQPSAPELARFLWNTFSAQDRERLINVSTLDTLKRSLLLAGLNRVLQGPSIYQADRFAGVAFSAEATRLVHESPQGAAVILLNRVLLDSAYPTQIASLAARQQTILSKGSTGYWLFVDGNHALRLYTGAPGSEPLSSRQTVPMDEWSHVAVVIQRGARKADFFINGEPDFAHSSVSFGNDFNNSNSLFIGTRGTPVSSPFHGELDEIRIWSLARDPLNIDFFSNRPLPLDAAGLAAYWKFDLGGDAAGFDFSFHGLDAEPSPDMDLALSQADGQLLPASALEPVFNMRPDPSAAGLWIGQVQLAMVNQVHARNNNDSETLGPTADYAAIRIVLHVDAQGTVRLLKDVTVMQRQDSTDHVLVTNPKLVGSFQGIKVRAGKKVAVRYGTAAYDFPSLELPLAGGLGVGAGCAGKINLPADFATNPFRHRYHPEHRSGFDISREISIQFKTAPEDPATAPPGFGQQWLTGLYRETVTGLHKLPIKAAGILTLHRISSVAVLNGGPSNP